MKWATPADSAGKTVGDGIFAGKLSADLWR
jgi:hypothetical protein